LRPPIGTAAVIHSVLSFPGVVVNKVLRPELPPYLSEGYVLRRERLEPHDDLAD